jgi:hypothetical protein
VLARSGGDLLPSVPCTGHHAYEQRRNDLEVLVSPQADQQVPTHQILGKTLPHPRWLAATDQHLVVRGLPLLCAEAMHGCTVRLLLLWLDAPGLPKASREVN